MGDFACVENGKKDIFSFYPGLTIYSGWVMQRKELSKEKDSYPLLSIKGRSDKCVKRCTTSIPWHGDCLVLI